MLLSLSIVRLVKNRVRNLLLLGGIETLLLGGLSGALFAALDEPLDLASRVGLEGLAVGDDLVDLAVADVALALHALGGDQALDLGGLGGLALTLAANDVLGDVVVLGETEQLTDLGGALGTQATGGGLVGETGNLGIALLDDDELHDGQVVTGDATANGLALAGTLAALTEGLHALGEEQADTLVGEDTLHHRETLLVIAARDTEDVALELFREDAAIHLGAHALVHERLDDTVRLLIDDLDFPRC